MLSSSQQRMLNGKAVGNIIIDRIGSNSVDALTMSENEQSKQSEILTFHLIKIEENLRRKVREFEEFQNNSSSDRQVVSMNNLVDEQKMSCFSRALEEVTEVSRSINPSMLSVLALI